MRAIMTGDEYLRFIHDEWDPDCDLYMDDVLYNLNGKPFDNEDRSVDFELCIKPTDEVEIVSGFVASNSDEKFNRDLVDFFLEWRQTQSISTILITVEKTVEVAFRSELAALAAKFGHIDIK